jgi:hypothetical protein
MAKKPKRPRDPSQLAKYIVDIATGRIELPRTNDGKNPAAVALGRRGGQVGGKRRAESLSAARRRQIAQVAAKARWGSKNEGNKS